MLSGGVVTSRRHQRTLFTFDGRSNLILLTLLPIDTFTIWFIEACGPRVQELLDIGGDVCFDCLEEQLDL